MKIEKYFILNKYIFSLFGVDEFKDFQEKLKDTQTDYDGDGRSYFLNVLLASFNNLISEDELLRYDENIKSYIEKINRNRQAKVKLKYFQYLAVLFTEIVLDNLKNRKTEFLNKLNEFFEKYKKEKNIDFIDKFEEDDLRKIAFWMATGSGKTLIMHINYYQFLHYNLFLPDNIILITPNEGLSKQHYEELQKSGIPCRLYGRGANGSINQQNGVLIIEITKLVEEKKGGGKTVPVNAFDGRNLIFVDEAHKGRKSEEQKWAKLRNSLAENGFVFEYSATFGQILSERERGKETLKEYAKSIIFDYSYKYFYLDGYGKDFSVLNVKTSKIPDNFQEVMFIANLLSFYEQILVYENNKHRKQEYNLEKPLWVFVGTTVSGKGEESDVIQIVKFIKKVIEDEDFLNKSISDILEGKTNLKGEEDKDIFYEKFSYLRNQGPINPSDIYKKVFGGTGALSLLELKNAEGEIGLRVGENDYFGVINIGNVSNFRKQLEKEGILVSQDVITDSLFDRIKEENSKINILIGSKKFIEGWDTWRVSSMGLLNIGNSQGPQIIQLFGRGVRIKGKGMSLKRSSVDPQIQILETLNIYGIKADYLNKFLDAIRKEEVEFETIDVPIELQHTDKWDTLYILSKPKKSFEEEVVLPLKIVDEVFFTINLIPKISLYQSKQEKETSVVSQKIQIEYKNMRQKLQSFNELLDWESIWQKMIEYKKQKNYWNLTFTKDDIKNIFLSDRYELFVREEVFNIKNKENIKLIEDIALLVIKNYIDSYYRKQAKRFETENLTCENLKELPFPKVSGNSYKYILQIDKSKEQIINNIKQLIQNLQNLSEQTSLKAPFIHFDRSLYLPLLIQDKSIERIIPQGLVDSEKEFLEKLIDYLKNHKSKFNNVEIYLLRNYPFSGTGFQLKWSMFYPDFIMWIKEDKKQTIVFVDPKGLEHMKGLDDEKIQFKNEIKKLEKKVCEENVVFESFILSKTPYHKLEVGKTSPISKDDYKKHHVLFLEDNDWVECFFQLLGFGGEQT